MFNVIVCVMHHRCQRQPSAWSAVFRRPCHRGISNSHLPGQLFFCRPCHRGISNSSTLHPAAPGRLAFCVWLTNCLLRRCAALAAWVLGVGFPFYGTINALMGSIADNTSGGAVFYRMSKAAQNAASKSLAHAFKAHGVTVLALHPGWVQTDMGGHEAPTTVAQSVAGMMQVVGDVTLAQSGSFVDFQGRTLPW